MSTSIKFSIVPRKQVYSDLKLTSDIAIMKLLIASLAFCQAAAFTAVHPSSARSGTFLCAGDYSKLDGEGKINLKIDLDSPKVATMDEIEKGKKVYCRCWLSGTFPLCDGTHQKHNEATGDNVGPLIVSVKKD